MVLTGFLRDQKAPSSDKGRVATAHGFRSSFRDWASEHGYPRDLAERALAHTIQNQAEAAYHRTDLLEQRRAMMEAWAHHVGGVRDGSSQGCSIQTPTLKCLAPAEPSYPKAAARRRSSWKENPLLQKCTFSLRCYILETSLRREFPSLTRECVRGIVQCVYKNVPIQACRGVLKMGVGNKPKFDLAILLLDIAGVLAKQNGRTVRAELNTISGYNDERIDGSGETCPSSTKSPASFLGN